MLSVHPCGFPHGPQPKAFEVGTKRLRSETNEVALYVDSRDPIEIAELPPGIEDLAYVDAWKQPRKE